MRARAFILFAAVLFAGCGAEYPDGATATTGAEIETASTTGSGSSGTTAGSSGSGSAGSSGGDSGSSTGGYGTNTWSNFALPFFEAHCTQCHAGEWSSYANVTSQQATVRQALASGAMPKEATLSDDERAEIVAWFDCGLPE